jgi:hypothetical protein
LTFTNNVIEEDTVEAKKKGKSRLAGLWTNALEPISLSTAIAPLLNDDGGQDALKILSDAIGFAYDLQNSLPSLSIDQCLLLVLYGRQHTGAPVFENLNAYLRFGIPEEMLKLLPFLRLLIGAFRQTITPIDQPFVYRLVPGVDLSQKLVANKVYRFWTFTSASMSEGMSVAFGLQDRSTSKTILRIKTRAAPMLQSFSAYSAVKDAVFLPGSAFKVTAVQPSEADEKAGTSLTYIDLEHIQEDLDKTVYK